MKLKHITLISTIGLMVSFAIFLLCCPWARFGDNPRMTASFLGTALMHISLLFFLINLYFRS